MSPKDPDPSPSDNARRLLREVLAKICTLETLLGNLHSTKGEFGSVKLDLRARLTACYQAREGLRRGEYTEEIDLECLLVRLRVKLDHRRFRGLGAVDLSEVVEVDLDELSRRLAN